MTKLRDSSIFYFGCMHNETGHYLWGKGGSRIVSDEVVWEYYCKDFPVRVHMLDGGFIPRAIGYDEGVATLAHISGWTILSFNDSSVDKRPGSHSAFVMRGTHNYETAKRLSIAHFPEVWGRFKFEVKQYCWG